MTRENEEPERTDTGDVGVRMCLTGERGDPRSDGDCGSGEVELCLDAVGDAKGDSCEAGGGERRGMAGRAWWGSR